MALGGKGASIFLLSSAQMGDLKRCLTSSCCLSKEEWKQGHSQSGPGTEEGPSKESVSWLNWENAEGRWVLCKLNCKASQDYLAPVF